MGHHEEKDYFQIEIRILPCSTWTYELHKHMGTSLGGRESSHGHGDGNWRASTDLTHIPKPSAADFGPNNRKSKGVHPRVNMMRLNHRQKSNINWSRALIENKPR